MPELLSFFAAHWNIFAIAAGVLALVFGVRAGSRAVGRRIEQSGLGVLFNFLRMLPSAADSIADKANQPRSLNGMETIYGPRLAEDFPSLRLEALGAEAENLLLKSYLALDEGRVTSEVRAAGGPIYAESLGRLITQHQMLGENAPKFSRIKIHRRVLSYYGRRDGKRVIEFQFAVEAVTGSERLGEGETRQYRDAMRYQYMEDILAYKQKSGGDETLTRNCPNCGAPLKGRNEEVCAYCGTVVKALELESWLPTELLPDAWLEAYTPSENGTMPFLG